MSIDKARELPSIQVSFGGGYNRNAAKLILTELYNDCGPSCVDRLISEFHLDEIFGIKPGSISPS
jgi:hypothetical protein